MNQSPTEAKSSRLPPPVAAFGFIFKALSRDRKALRVLIACTLAMLTTTLEPAYLTLASPEIQSQLRLPETRAPMYVAAAFLILAVLTLIAGTTGDLFGRKLVLVTGLVGLSAANLLAAFTLGTPQFVLADALSVVTAILVIPMCVAVVTTVFEPAIRPFAYGTLFGFLGLGLVLGPTLGGIFEGLGIPRVAFIPVLIIGLLALWQVIRHVSESRAPKAIRRASALFNLLLLAGIFLLVYLLIAARSLLSSWMPFLLAGGALLVLVVFIRWLVQRVNYFRGVELFTGRDTALAILAGIVLSFGSAAFFYQIATFFQNIQKMPPVLAGIALTPYVIGLLIGSLLIARLALRFGARTIIVTGLVLMGIGMVWLSFTQVDSPYWFFIAPMLVMGFGFGLAVPVRTQVVLAAPPPDLVGSAAAINTAAGQSGYALGVVLSSVLVTQLADSAFLRPLAAAGVSESVVQQIKDALPSVVNRAMAGDYPNLPAPILALAQSTYLQAFTTGLGQMYLVFALITFITAAVIFFGMRRGLKASVAMPLDQIQHQDETAPRG